MGKCHGDLPTNREGPFVTLRSEFSFGVSCRQLEWKTGQLCYNQVTIVFVIETINITVALDVG